MENDNDIQQSESLYSTFPAISLIENLFELFGINTCSFDGHGQGRAVVPTREATVKEMGQGLHHKSWMARLEAVKSLGVLGKQAEPVLTRMLQDENECVRLLAQYELQRLALKEVPTSVPTEYMPPKASSYFEEHLPEQLPREEIQREEIQTKESAQQKYRYTLTWRELLEVILEDSYALEKITTLLHVNAETIMHWLHYKKNPDFRILQQILEAFPDDYDALLELIKREFPHFVPERLADDAPREILAPFYDRLSKSLCEDPPTLRFWSTCQFVLQQAVQQLDPYRTGMMAAIMICTAPSPGEKVRSLHGYLGLGSSVWTGNWYQQPLFFGSDSLSGYAATVGNVQVIHDVKSDLKGISFYDVDDIRSVLVVPILSAAGKCAGCLYVTSTAPYYFCSRRLRLVQAYAEYLARAFSPEEFYAPEQIQLAVLPYKTQTSYFNTIRKNLHHNTRDVFINRQDKQKDWKVVEEELISFTQEKQENVRTRIPATRPIAELGIQQARAQIEAELSTLLSAMSSPESRPGRLA